MKRTFTLFLIISLLILGGISFAGHQGIPLMDKNRYDDPRGSNPVKGYSPKLPAWVNNANADKWWNFAVGDSQSYGSNESEAISSAFQNAKMLLAKKIQSKVEGSVRRYMVNNNIGGAPALEKLPGYVANRIKLQIVDRAEFRKSHVAKDGNVYVLAAIAPHDLRTMVVMEMENAIRDKSWLWRQYQQANLYNSMEKFLTSDLSVESNTTPENSYSYNDEPKVYNYTQIEKRADEVPDTPKQHVKQPQPLQPQSEPRPLSIPKKVAVKHIDSSPQSEADEPLVTEKSVNIPQPEIDSLVVVKKVAKQSSGEPVKTTGLKINGTYNALIIGINDYKFLPKLKTAVKDANLVAETLKKNYGFNVTVLTDAQATRAGIMEEINVMRKRLSPDDKLIIYYAGHGIFEEKTDTAYWLPIDAKPDDNTEWIMSASLTSNLKAIAARSILIVADSCYSGTLTRSVDVKLSTNDTRANFLTKMLGKTSRVLIASGGNEPVSDGGGGGHSIFAKAFANALQQMDRDMFTADELFVNQIKEPVAGNAKQTPEYKIIRDSGHEGGDFVFLKR